MHLSPARSSVQMETEAGAGALVLPTGVTVQGWDLSVPVGSTGTQQPCILNVAPPLLKRLRLISLSVAWHASTPPAANVVQGRGAAVCFAKVLCWSLHGLAPAQA